MTSWCSPGMVKPSGNAENRYAGISDVARGLEELKERAAMACRSTPGMSVPMGLANTDSGLDDDQIQSLVHQLRHEYAGHQQHGTEPSDRHPTGSTGDPAAAWDRFRSSTATRITAHPSLRPQRRAGLLRRITQAGDTSPADMVLIPSS